MARNPVWDRDELILALNLYLRERRVLGRTDARVVGLSAQLRRLPLHSERMSDSFRTPDAVVMKLANFRALDPQSSRVGLQAGGKLDAEIWERFSGQPQQLASLASSIAEAAGGDDLLPVEHEEEFPEGRLLLRVHCAYERSRRAVEQKRSLAAAEGKLRCEACGLDPSEIYADRSGPVLECHHLVPLGGGGQRETRPSDLALLCANCHRAIHALRPWPKPDELAAAMVRLG